MNAASADITALSAALQLRRPMPPSATSARPGIFAQDVSALSHESGEWMDDPLVVNTNGNTVACGILEVGDPEEGFSNYGAFPYTLGGSTYNLQDLVVPTLFRRSCEHLGKQRDDVPEQSLQLEGLLERGLVSNVFSSENPLREKRVFSLHVQLFKRA